MSFADVMKRLKKEYVEMLPEKIETIETHYNDQNIDFLREDFHKLKGTGKTYGLPEISELAEVVEQLCLHKPQEAYAIIPDAMELLRDIHNKRRTDLVVDIDGDDRFQNIRALAV